MSAIAIVAVDTPCSDRKVRVRNSPRLRMMTRSPRPPFGQISQHRWIDLQVPGEVPIAGLAERRAPPRRILPTLRLTVAKKGLLGSR